MLRTYELSRAPGGAPLYEQLYRAIRADILSGQLAGGEKLPSRRALAEHLNVSKITVETAYAQLLAEGYVTARQRSGYYVEQLSALQPAEPQPRVPAKPEAPEPPAKPSAALFPFSVWAKLMRGVILDEGEALLRPMPGAGLYALRRAICDDLLRRRGMHVEPRQVYIGAGAEYFYHLLLEFFGRDRVYGLETLGHRKIARIYAASGVQCRAIAMDDDGVLLDALAASGAEILHLSPSHHYPTGIVVSCQTQRDQFQNKETCMRMLRSKLIEIKEREHLDKISDIKGTQLKIEWGSQIRNYVFMPYTLAKDTRTGYEMTNINAVMDGDLDGFINAYLTCLATGNWVTKS